MLTVVPTPIGNLQDITLRALQALREADLIAAEDTRRSGMLLLHHNIKTPMLSLHEHNEISRTARLVEEVAEGRTIALVTDAGMPGISDPGFRLIRACRERGLEVAVLPGPSAVITALVGSGLPSNAFFFGGFLPVKSGRRRQELERASSRPETSVYFESPHRLLKTLEVLCEVAPAALICVARELTKKFEEYRRGPAAELLAHYKSRQPKGEITLVISHSPETSPKLQTD
ncbi:MAG TPA: 16S rRNA (cytidine(1402)-2'-O)-methyltransferase [Terrimicrobiaceae bacterium]